MKQELRQLTIDEIIERNDLKELKRLSHGRSLKVETVYQGNTFTVAEAEFILNGRAITGEGIARRSGHGEEILRPIVGINLAWKRALTAIDKKLRRPTHEVGDKYEG